MKNLAELAAIRDKMRNQINNREVEKDGDIVIKVGMATCGIAAGARPVMTAFLEEISKRGLKHVKITQTGCVGMCRLEPMADIFVNGEKVTYIKLTPEKVAKIVAEHIVNGNICTEYVIGKEN